MLRDEFEADYEIVEAENGLEALSYMEKNIGDICAVLLDIVMPEMDGIQLLKKMNEEKYMNTFPVIVITSEHPIGVVEECFDYGKQVRERRRCVDCGRIFEITNSEYDFYIKKGFELPKRCKTCKKNKSSRSWD